MKPKLSFSTIRLLFDNTGPDEELSHKEVVREILNSKKLLQEYIADLQHDIKLTDDDKWQKIKDHNSTMRKSVKELKQLL